MPGPPEPTTAFDLGRPPIPRSLIQRWSAALSVDSTGEHDAAIRRLVRGQPAVLRYVGRQVGTRDRDDRAPGVARYLAGVVLRMFELAGGRCGRSTPSLLSSAETHVQARLDAVVDGRRLLPFDGGFSDRARRFVRTQGPLLDELLWSLFDDPAGSTSLPGPRRADVYVALWAVVHAIDGVWTPPPAHFTQESP